MNTMIVPPDIVQTATGVVRSVAGGEVTSIASAVQSGANAAAAAAQGTLRSIAQGDVLRNVSLGIHVRTRPQKPRMSHPSCGLFCGIAQALREISWEGLGEPSRALRICL